MICVSEFTAAEAADFIGLADPIVIPNGVDDAYLDAAPLSTEVLTSVGIRGPYVLYAGGSASRKNLPTLAAAWKKVAAVRPEWQLALAGPVNEARVGLFASSPRVAHLGRLDDALMPGLVAAADVVVVPSLYEGFGLPALEAMAAGTPLLSSNASSLPEVVGGTGTLVDPTVDALASGLEYVTSGASQIHTLAAQAKDRARHFTWRRAAERHAAVWRSVR